MQPCVPRAGPGARPWADADEEGEVARGVVHGRHGERVEHGGDEWPRVDGRGTPRRIRLGGGHGNAAPAVLHLLPAVAPRGRRRSERDGDEGVRARGGGAAPPGARRQPQRGAARQHRHVAHRRSSREEQPSARGVDAPQRERDGDVRRHEAGVRHRKAEGEGEEQQVRELEQLPAAGAHGGRGQVGQQGERHGRQRAVQVAVAHAVVAG